MSFADSGHARGAGGPDDFDAVFNHPKMSLLTSAGARVRPASLQYPNVLAAIAVIMTAAPRSAHAVSIVNVLQVAASHHVAGIAATGATSFASDSVARADSASAVAAVEQFRAALSRGDSAMVLAMLAPDAVVLESGDVETRAEYRRHHLPADIEFARAVPGTHEIASVVVHGDAAWVSSKTVTQGRMKDRPVNSAGAELIVLSRRDKNSPWQIRAIHWSSRRRTS